MTPEPDPIALYLDQAGILLHLPIRAEDYQEVLAAFRVLHAQGELVTEFALPANTEPAPRFIP